MIPAYRVSVTRPLDLQRFSDRLALASLFVFGAAGYLWGGWAEGVESGLAAYLCWALSREIDPDYPVSANLAALAGGGLALWLDSHAGVLFVMLLVIKVMVGSSGLAPARWEAGLLGLGAVVFSGTQTGWWAGAVMAAALFLDTCIPPVASASHRWIAGGVGVGASLFYLFLGEVDSWWWAHLAAASAASLILVYGRLGVRKGLIIALSTAGLPAVARMFERLAGDGLQDGSLGIYLLVGAGLVFALALGAIGTDVKSPTDHADRTISSDRVGMARLLLGAFVIVSGLSAATGSVTQAFAPSAPLLAVVIVVAVREFLYRTRWKSQRRGS